MADVILKRTDPVLNPVIPVAGDDEGFIPLSEGPMLRTPFRGGAVTAIEKAMLPSGQFSMVQNMRQIKHGKDKGAFEKRKGQIVLHTVADGTNKLLSLYQFSKGKKTERHFYAQMSDNDVLEATNAPPTVTTGAFGTEVFSGSASSIPASWSNLDDTLFFSNGVDQHQIYPGQASYVWKFIVHKGTAAPVAIPAIGEDYTEQVTDGLTTTVAVLDSLGDLAVDYDCIFIMAPVPIDTLTWTVSSANGTASVAGINYKKNDNTWTAVSGFTDNTIVSACTLGQSGTMTFTMPTDSMPSYMYGANGYWYQVYLSSGDLDAEVRVSSVTFETDWQGIQNIWDGVLVDAIEAQVNIASATPTYLNYSSDAVTISALTATGSICVYSYDPIVGVYIDVGKTPNTTASTTINAGYYWNGTAFTTVGTITDGTAGCSKSGFVTFGRQSAVQPVQHNTGQYYAYVYKFTVDQTLSASLSIAIQTMPYFDITELGKGQCNCAWKDRILYSFDRYPSYVYIPTSDNPQCFNGDEYGILQAGDGRANKVVCMKRYYNEVMVWQEEKGVEGGCLTLFEGYSADTFGKLIISSELGLMNSKCAAVVDGVLTSTATDESIKTLAFCLSRKGVYVTDGRTCSMISDDIQNYFDPRETECIRRGYEADMWLKHDSSDNTIRVGLVSGSSATVPNIFPVFDLGDKTWSFDVRGQALSSMEEVEAASGDIAVLQVGGGTADGFVYLLNNSANDVSTAIDAYCTMELNADGLMMLLREIILRMKVQAAGDCTITPYLNGIAQSTITKSMTAETANELMRRHRFGVNLRNSNISLKFQNATASQSIYLEDLGLKLFGYETH